MALHQVLQEAQPNFSFKRLLKTSTRQFFSLLLILSSAYLFVILSTYDPSDPSWNTVVEGPVQNWGGSLGAILADLFHQFFGSASFFTAFVLGINGIRTFFSSVLRRYGWSLYLLPFAQLICSCFCAHLMINSPLSIQTGGALGVLSIPFFVKVFTIFPWAISSLQIRQFLGILTFFLFIFCLNVRLEDFRTFLRMLYLLPTKVQDFLQKILLAISIYKQKIQNLKRIKTDFVKNTSPKQFQEEPTFSFEPSSFSPETLKKESIPLDIHPEIFSEPTIKQEQAGPYKERPMENTPILAKINITPPQTVSMTSSKKNFERPELDLKDHYHLPALDLLTLAPQENSQSPVNEAYLLENAKQLMSVLEDFGIRGEVTKVHPGPVVTLYELVPAPGIKASRVIGLADDIARSMSALSTRIAVIPGHNAIGIELPNKIRQTVYLRELLTSRDYEISGPKLPLGLGKDIGGGPVIADLARMPHLLVAGTTGAGKSVAINTMILSLLYRLSPKHCRFIMIDPKMLELSVYDGIPHLLAPVVTEPKKAVFALKWTVKEMEDRYRAMSKLGVRNIEGYNSRLAQALAAGEELTRQVQTGFDEGTGRPIFEVQPLDMTPLPYIVVVVDEMADLMLVAGKDIEATVQRLAQMARAAGIHLIMATQRPSVDVITGTIKANFPTRISFQVTSRFDSRTILGEQGAEQLLGRGDMLYMEGGGKIQRVHGPFVSDEEVINVVRYLKDQAQPDYIETITEEDPDVSVNSFGSGDDKEDALYQQAVQLVRRERKASTSFIQRHLRVGYNTAARLMEQMELEGVVSAANHVGKREILLTSN